MEVFVEDEAMGRDTPQKVAKYRLGIAIRKAQIDFRRRAMFARSICMVTMQHQHLATRSYGIEGPTDKRGLCGDVNDLARDAADFQELEAAMIPSLDQPKLYPPPWVTHARKKRRELEERKAGGAATHKQADYSHGVRLHVSR